MHVLKTFLLIPVLILITAQSYTATRDDDLEIDTRFDIEQKGGCQDAKPFDTNVTIEVLPQKVEFEKDIEHVNFAALTQAEINRWSRANNLYTYWIPEDHLRGGNVIVSGLGYSVDVERYESPIDKGGQLVCGYFSNVDITLYFASKVMISDRISSNKCQYEVYIEHMEKHNELDQETIFEYVTKLKNGEVHELIKFAEGDRYVLNNRWRIQGLVRKQSADISRALGGYVQLMASEAEFRGTRFDLSESFIEMDTKLKACN
ncbi:MAG: hypothetical protein AAF569_08370 [Pseudomonadota bacterium]